MAAAGKKLESKAEDVWACPACQGAGIVSYWSEFAYFEDRRSCQMCEEGHKIDAKIADIISRVQAEEHALRR